MDGTLTPGVLGLRLLEELLAQGACDRVAAARIVAAVTAYREGRADRTRTVAIAYRHYARAVAETPPETVNKAAIRAWHRHRDDLFPFTVPLLAELRERGYLTILISGSPHEIVSVAAADLGIDYAQGARLLIRAGRFTDAVLVGTGLPDTKHRVLHQLARRARVSLDDSFGVGNSVADVRILRHVSRPLAFEPDSRLLATARALRWPVADRDDVVETYQAMLGETGSDGADRRVIS